MSSANALNAGTDATVRLVGAPLGATLMITFGFPLLIWTDIASYALSALAVLATERRRAAPAGTAVDGVLRDLRHGLTVICRHPMSRWLLVINTIFLTANASLSAILVPFGVTALGGPQQVGSVISALGVGFLGGAALIRVLVDRVQPRYLLAASLAGTGTGFILLFSARSLVPALMAAAAIGIFGSMTLVTPQTTLQRVTPNGVLGRVSAVFFTGEALAALIGAVTGPTLAGTAGIVAVARIACILTMITAVMALSLLPGLAVLTPAVTDGTGTPVDNSTAGASPL